MSDRKSRENTVIERETWRERKKFEEWHRKV